jgi:CspA family cold shock protein
MDVDIMIGTVTWFSDEKGYGFVQSEKKDYFVHYKEINGEGFKSLKQGDKVIFEPASSPKGLVAKNLRKDT